MRSWIDRFFDFYGFNKSCLIWDIDAYCWLFLPSVFQNLFSFLFCFFFFQFKARFFFASNKSLWSFSTQNIPTSYFSCTNSRHYFCFIADDDISIKIKENLSVPISYHFSISSHNFLSFQNLILRCNQESSRFFFVAIFIILRDII